MHSREQHAINNHKTTAAATLGSETPPPPRSRVRPSDRTRPGFCQCQHDRLSIGKRSG